ncbi:hypothetical protein [Sulfitobacter sp. MF3-043]|uniref:hypothetical protein n=1 Tax=Sulfitobacter sediminivivens TaxID=3252902 RepID=UPI0036D810AE
MFDAARRPQDGLHHSKWPMDGQWAMFKMLDVGHVVFDNLSFRNCWPQVFYLRGCQDITFRNINGTGARNVIFVRNSDHTVSRGFLVEGMQWVQDVDHDMWAGRVKWKEVKERAGFENKSWFNGALFESYDILGEVTIRDCDVSHAFNAIRMDIKPERVSVEEGQPIISRNRNVRIYRNRFSYIRDNAVEPEKGLHGWLVAENTFFQVHAALSCDAVSIRDGAFVSNCFLNLSRPDDASNTGGKIVKFLSLGDPTPRPLCLGFVTAFNSIRSRTRLVAGARLKDWCNVNNAVERFAASDRDDVTLFAEMEWFEDAFTDAMATNDPGYPDVYHAEGGKVGDWSALPQVFDFDNPDSLCKGQDIGWDGSLPLSSEAAALISIPVTIHGPEDLKKRIPRGGSVGFRNLFDLGLDQWLN